MYDIEKILEKYLGEAQSGNAALEAARYSLLGGGKRLRPNFVLQSATMLSGADENAERLAAGVEMIHTYSLIHDDLPAMDDDDFRRGKPSCHKKFGEAMAILAGDALLSLAFEIMTAGECGARYLAAVNYIAKMSGHGGMVCGQSLDISGRNKTKKQYLDMIKLKTANMFAASIAAPALYFGAEEKYFNELENFGFNYGIFFQAADDAADGDGWASQNKAEAAKIATEALEAAKQNLAVLKEKYDVSYFESVLEKAEELLPQVE